MAGPTHDDADAGPSLGNLMGQIRPADKIKDLPVILGRGTFNFDNDRGARYEGVIMTVKNGKFVPAPE